MNQVYREMCRIWVVVLYLHTLCQLYNPCESVNSVNESVSIIISFKTLLSTGCITLYESDNQNKEAVHRSIATRKMLSKSVISTAYYNKGLSKSSIKIDRCKQSRPLVVVCSGNTFLQQIRKQAKLSSYPRWLLFLNSEPSSLDEIFDDVDVPFDCEVVVVESRDTNKVELTEVYRITEGGPLMKEHYGTWGPQGLKVNRQYLYERRNDLKGLVVKVAVDIASIRNFNIDCEYESRLRFDHFMICVWIILQRRLNFTSDIIPNTENLIYRWGKRFEDGSWSGIIGMLDRKEVDVGVADFSFIKTRIDVIDFLMPVVPVSVQMYISEVKPKTIGGWNNFLKPFTSNLWFAILGSIFVMGVMISVVLSVSRRHYHQETKGRDVYHITENILQVFGIYCHQGQDETPKSSSARIVYLMAGVTSVVVLAAYSAALISSLANQKTELPFETLEGFMEDGTYNLGILDGTTVSELFFNSSDPLLRRVYKKYFSDSQELFLDATFINEICNGNAAFLAARDSFEYMFNKSCKTIQIPETYLKHWLSIIVVKGSPYRNILNHNLRQLRDIGVLRRLLKRAWPNDAIVLLNVNTVIDVTLAQVLPLLVIFVLGIGLSTFLLIAEVMNNKSSDNC